MSGPDPTRTSWRTSTRSTDKGNCVEVAHIDGAVAVRDSKDRKGPVLLIDSTGWSAFLAGVRHGEFDPH